MTLNFDFEQIKTVEFGVGRDDGVGQTFRLLTVDGDVQGALREMAEATWVAMQRDSDSPSKYEPSEKHAGSEYVHLPLDDELAVRMRELHQANNMAVDSGALSEPAAVFCYFARLTDGKGRRLTALRRAIQFKGVLKSRLIHFVTDALKLVEDQVFRLDTDFDLLIDSKAVHILRPSGFEFAGNLQEAILQAAPKNIAAIEKDLPFVDFAAIGDYATKHPRAARYLASIRGQKETKSIDKAALRKLCKQTGVEVQVLNGKITIADGHEMGFLEVLDRRRYELELVKGSPERFRAASRRKIEN
jgi:hypothetical protein